MEDVTGKQAGCIGCKEYDLVAIPADIPALGVKIGGTGLVRDLDLRVGDHAEPVAELRRLYEVAKVELLPFVEALPTREEPEDEMGEEIRGTLIPES